MGACSTGARDVLRVEADEATEQGTGTNSEGPVLLESDSESEVVQHHHEFVASVPRVFHRAGFLKRTYGVDASQERRRKSAKLDEQLDGLRAVLPDVASRSKESTNVVVDAYHYIATLQRQVEDLNAELNLDDAPARTWDGQSCEAVSCRSGLWQQPIVDVARRDGFLEVRIVCANRPGLLVDIMEAVESRGLTILQAKIACHNEIVVEYLSLENEESESLLTEGEKADSWVVVDRVKAMLVHAICNGGQCGADDLQ